MPGQAPPPPTGTTAVSSGPSGALHTGDAWLLMASRFVVSKPGQALPPPTGTAAWLSGPSGALHTGGAWRAGVWFGASP